MAEPRSFAPPPDGRLYAALVHSLGGIVWEADPQTFRFLYVSPQAERILGYPVHQWLDEPTFWRAHTHPDDVAWCSAYCLDCTQRGQDHAFEYRMIAADGQVVWLHDVVTIKHEEDGSARLRGIMLDVTQRKRAEEAQRQAEAERDLLLTRLRLQFEGMPAGCMLNDPELRITDLNPAGEKILGFRREELLGRDPREVIVPPSARVAVEEALRRAQDSETPIQVVLENLTHDGRIILCEWTGAPLRAADGRLLGYVAMFQDVTQRRRLEEQLRQAQKMEALGRLASGVAHDFNNLLTAVTGYAEILLGQLDEPDPRREFAQEITKAAARAADLTGQLLALGRRQLAQPRACDLNAVLLDAEKLLCRLIGEDVTLVTMLHPELGPIRADPGQVHQVILNLAVNARDAMPRGGTLTLETADVAGAQPPGGRRVLLRVSDTGCGMTDEVKARLFEPFFTTKEVGKGTGLGLATVYGIVQAHGGAIEVESEPGLGSTFRVYFPRAETTTSTVPAAVAADWPRGAETVLLVEDEPAVRAFAGFVLSQAGYTLLLAGDGEEGLTVCREHSGPIHLLVTDVVMPHRGGRELAEEAARLRPGLRVLYLSGYTDEAIVHHGLAEGGMAFLQKPFRPHELAAKVREVLDR